MSDESLRGVELVGGIATLLFGIAAVFWPSETTVILLYLFATYVLISGVVCLITGLARISLNGTSSVLRILLGVLLLGVGVYFLRHPHVTFHTLILLIGFTLIVRGVFDVIAGFVEDSAPTSRTLTVIAGILAVIVGIIVLFQPVASGIAFVWLVGLYALIAGPIMIARSFEDNKSKPARAR